jgi:hypothetical protein
MSDDVVDLSDPERIDDGALARAIAVLRAEQQRRSVERADPDALVEEGFTAGFLANGMPQDPWLRSGVLVCPGAKIDRSVMNHRCAFVRIGEKWVWEHADRLEDTVRYLPGAQNRMQSVTLVPVGEGEAVDLVEARTRQGVHELVGVRSFVVEDGLLVLVSARSVAKVSHR